MAWSICPNLSYTALEMSEKNSSMTITDHWKVNVVLRKERQNKSKVRSGRVDNMFELHVIGFGENWFKSDEKQIRGVHLLLTKTKITSITTLYWKSKQSERVSHLSKDVETLNILRMVNYAVFMVSQIEMLLHGNYRMRIPVICLLIQNCVWTCGQETTPDDSL